MEMARIRGAAGKRGQGTIEYVLLIALVVMLAILVKQGLYGVMRDAGNRTDIVESSRKSFTNGNYQAGGFKETNSGQAVRLNPRLNPGQFHLFKRGEGEN